MSTLLSVRGEARRTVTSDQASLFAAVTEVADSKAAAAALASGTLDEVLAALLMSRATQTWDS